VTARKRLSERLDAARAARFVDLPVPDVEGVFVRYRALPAKSLDAIADRYSPPSNGQRNRPRRRPDRDPAVLSASIDVLVDACVGVWELSEDDHGEPVGIAVAEGFSGHLSRDEDGRWQLSGELPTFSDPELAEELGLDPDDTSAGATVRALYVAEGDLIGASDAVVTHSGTSGEDLLAEARGN
jgi:hypothetical protein